MKIKKTLSLTILITLIAFSLSGCASNADTSSSTFNVRIAFFPNINHGQALIEKDQGKFEKAFGQNVNVEWKQFNSGTAEIEALFAGEIDLGYIGPGPAINGFIKSNGAIKIIAGSADAGATFISRNDITIKNLKEDLKGKRIAVPSFGNTQDVMLRALLKSNSLQDTTSGGTIEIVPVKNPDLKTLFDKKEIDCAYVPEPWGSTLIKDSNANVILDYNELWRDGKYPTTVIIARTEFMEKYPDIVEKFLETHYEVTNYINNNKADALQIIKNQINEITGSSIEDEVMNASVNRIIFTVNPEKEAVYDMSNTSKGLGFIEDVSNVKNIFDMTYINKILKSSGEDEIN